MVQSFRKIYVILLLLVLIAVSRDIGLCDGAKVIADGRLASVDVVSEIPFELMGNIFIKVKVNNSDKEYTFIFDTGASSVLLSKKVATELGNVGNSSETIVHDAVNASQKAELISLKSLKVGEIEVKNCRALIVDLDTLESFGYKVDGILGNSFLKFLQVKIDYNNKILTLSSAQNSNIESNQGYKFKIFQSSGLISTKLQMGLVGYPNSWLIQSAIIDTGAAGDEYLLFPFNCLERVKPELNCKLFKTIGFGSGGLFGDSEAMVSRISTMELGGFKINNIPVKFSGGKRIYLTNSFLSHFTVTINYPKLEMLLVPNENKSFKMNFDSFGFAFKKDQDGKVKVIGLWEGSPAEKNGLKIGDEIINFSVNEISNVKYEDLISYLLSDEDITLRLQIVNNSGQRQVALKKAKLLPEI